MIAEQDTPELYARIQKALEAKGHDLEKFAGPFTFKQVRKETAADGSYIRYVTLTTAAGDEVEFLEEELNPAKKARNDQEKTAPVAEEMAEETTPSVTTFEQPLEEIPALDNKFTEANLLANETEYLESKIKNPGSLGSAEEFSSRLSLLQSDPLAYWQERLDTYRVAEQKAKETSGNAEYWVRKQEEVTAEIKRLEALQPENAQQQTEKPADPFAVFDIVTKEESRPTDAAPAPQAEIPQPPTPEQAQEKIITTSDVKESLQSILKTFDATNKDITTSDVAVRSDGMGGLTVQFKQKRNDGLFKKPSWDINLGLGIENGKIIPRDIKLESKNEQILDEKETHQNNVLGALENLHNMLLVANDLPVETTAFTTKNGALFAYTT
jgi:hypothetical protein